jgi:hypothetical protein
MRAIVSRSPLPEAGAASGGPTLSTLPSPFQSISNNITWAACARAGNDRTSAPADTHCSGTQIGPGRCLSR